MRSGGCRVGEFFGGAGMDPATMNMMNEGSFANGNANTEPYNSAEIWQFPLNGAAGLGESGGGLGLRRPQFGPSLEQFSEFTSGPDRDGPGNDPIGSEQRENGVNRKRRDSEDESTKGVSNRNGGTGNSNGNGVVITLSLCQMI